MAQLHETGYGRKLLEHDIPSISESLSKIADELSSSNKNKFIEFMEYEEALTTDLQSKHRIRSKLEALGIWKPII